MLYQNIQVKLFQDIQEKMPTVKQKAGWQRGINMPCGEIGMDFLLIVGLCATVGGMAMYIISDKLKKRQKKSFKTHWYRDEGYQ